MKKLFVAIIAIGFFSWAFSQAKKPTIMVVPSDAWCTLNGYMMQFENQGSLVLIPDYKIALQTNPNLLLAIGKINELMASRGFPLKNLESVLKSLQDEATQNNVSTSKGGASIAESPIDKLKKTAKADIIMQLTWSLNTVGPKKSLTFNLQGLDAYTNKQIAGASGTGSPGFSVELPVLLEEAVVAHLDNFNVQLQNYFDDLFKNGREITMRIKTWDNFEGGLEKNIAGKELGEIIEKWMADNTVQGRFSTTDATENMMFFEQVRIPMLDANGKGVDARSWARGLQKMLKDTYQIESKLTMKGLGEVSLIIGEK